MFYKVFVNNLNLETSWEFIFTTTRKNQQSTFHSFALNWQHLNYLNIKGVPCKVCQGLLLKAWKLI